jgi:hypothetical protein
MFFPTKSMQRSWYPSLGTGAATRMPRCLDILRQLHAISLVRACGWRGNRLLEAGRLLCACTTIWIQLSSIRQCEVLLWLEMGATIAIELAFVNKIFGQYTKLQS